MTLEHALELLAEVGAADTVHPSGTLLAHLRGTHACLERWGCPEHLRAAGLYHSIYGTEAFRTATIALAERDRVRARIGAAAEELVYLYCVAERRSLHENLDRGAPYRVVERASGRDLPLASLEQLADLITLDLANRLEQFPRAPMSLWRMRADGRIYEKAVPLLPRAAVEELRHVYRRRAWPLIAVDALRRRLARRESSTRDGGAR